MFGLGVWELLIILCIVIVVFGAAKLPMIGEGLGKGIKNFRKEVKTEKKEEDAEKSDQVIEHSVDEEKDKS